jgi:murein DD-endopeptidase MepM/ murein hydrolase activator NlpD
MNFGRWARVLWLFLVLGLYGFIELSSRWVKNLKEFSEVNWINWQEFVERHLDGMLELNRELDFPVKPPDAEGVRIARAFGFDGHLGEDWNVGVGNEDLGEPVYSVGDGFVTLAMDFEGAWGKVVMVLYKVEWEGKVRYVEMMFAHLDAIFVEPFTVVPRGKLLGTIGNGEGLYAAHLHWEVRMEIGFGLGGGYAGDEGTSGWVSGSDFISRVRGAVGKYVFLPQDKWEAWGSD